VENKSDNYIEVDKRGVFARKRKILARILMICLLGLSIIAIIIFSPYLILFGGAF